MNASPFVRTVCALVAAMGGFSLAAFGANTVYVDGGLHDYAGHDGSTPAKAYRTIQEGVDAASTGDTVQVAAGVYSTGGKPAASGYAACRVYVDKNLTLKGAGRDVTHIVGAFADTVAKTGTAAVAGIVIASAANGTRIEGFTIRDCADSKKSGGGNGSGTAVCSLKTKISDTVPLSMSDRPWLVDCAVSNIYASVGAVAYVNAARTIFQNCVGYDFASVADYCDLVFCLLVHQLQDANRHTYRGNRNNDTYGTRIVNCTVLDARGVSNGVNMMSSSGSYYLQNSIVDYGGIYSAQVDCCVVAPARNGIGNSSKPVHVNSTNELATSVFGVSDQVVASVGLNDFRLIRAVDLLAGSATNSIPDSPALNLADFRHLEAFPEEFRWKDVYGNPVVTNAAGKLHAGAVQATMTPLAAFKVTDNGEFLSLNGTRGCSDGARTHFVDTWPVMVKTELPVGKELSSIGQKNPFFGVWISDDGTGENRFVFPNSLGRLPLVPAKGRLMQFEPRQATDVVYVDASKENGSADTGSGTAASPYARIQKAVNSIATNQSKMAVIYVAPGVYDKGVTTATRPNPDCRVNVNRSGTSLRLIGTGGAERTIIAGAADTSAFAEGGCLSTNAIRCIQAGGNTAAFQGFTLTGGHTAKGGEPGVGSGNSYGRGGALWANNSKNAWLIECIVTNNAAYYGGAAMANGNAVNCSFADNRIVGSGSIFDIQNIKGHYMASSCVINEKMSGSAAGATVFLQDKNVSGYAVNCTVLGDASSTLLFDTNMYSFLQNSILVHALPQTSTVGFRRMEGTFVWDFDYAGGLGNVEGVKYFAVDPQFADEAHGDYRLLRSSPAYGGGNMWTAGATSAWEISQAYRSYYRLLFCDMDGNWPVFVNGKPSAGAYQVPVDKVRVTTSLPEIGGVTLVSPATQVVDWNAPLTITAANGRRQVVGFMVNGRYFPAQNSSVTFTPSEIGATTCEVAVVANTDWYVAANGGSDANTGWSETDAFHTLTGALAAATSGDTVIALPGVYDEGSSLHTNVIYYYDKTTDTIRLPSRAVIPPGVRLVSRDGAEATVIKGAFGANAATGTGDGAIRCVLLGKGAVVKGFTVTGGGTLEGDTTYQYEFFDNLSGGGILSAERPIGIGKAGDRPKSTGYAEDCIISNNASCGDGAAYFGSYVHCLFVRNRHCAVREPHYLYGCVIGDNETGTSAQAVYQPYFTDSCTFFGGDVKADGKDAASMYNYPGSALWIVRNSVFLGDKPNVIKWVYNCCFRNPNGLYANDTKNVWEGVRYDPTLDLDAAYRPARTCAAVDAWRDGLAEAGNTAFKFATPDVYVRDSDFAGGQRVYNGAMDIGAGECDWRPRFGAVLGGGRRNRVVSASPGVVEDGNGVCPGDGESLVSACDASASGTGTCVWTVEVPATGTLAVSVNGGAAQVLQTGTFAPDLTLGANTLAFSHVGEGQAVLKRCRSNVGCFLIVR